MRNVGERLQPRIFRLFLLLLHRKTDASPGECQSGDEEEATMSRDVANQARQTPIQKYLKFCKILRKRKNPSVI